MGLLIAFLIFAAGLILSLIKGWTLILPLLLGLALFTCLGLKRGFKPGQLARWSWGSIKDSLVVIEVMLLIGFITAAWRVSGTITVFVYYGMKVIVPPLFLLITFLLTCLLSYAIGTSFGVAGTLGVIFMTLARSGGVDPLLTAGVLMSGIYYGDRGSPVSSSANMVAGITHSEIYGNVKLMHRTGLLPLLITAAAYTVLSVTHPISHVDPAIVQAFESEFNLSLWAFVPAVIMLMLPLLKVGVMISIAASVLSAVIIARVVQGVPLFKVIVTCVMGYTSDSPGLGEILNGGGMVSMLEIVGILVISCAYSGIFTGTDMLKEVQSLLERWCRRAGRFAVTLVVGLLASVIFCNQTIATLICNDLMGKPYEATGGTDQEMAIDMENSLIVTVGLIPWCIACSVPLTFFGVGIGAIPWAFYLYLIPLCYLFTKSRWFSNRADAG
ncbi:MAG: sodium:proton antiporter [Firmicutes bacterium]|nr:sodium:proton antiporter [Bacillota bacterium]